MLKLAELCMASDVNGFEIKFRYKIFLRYVQLLENNIVSHDNNIIIL